MENARLRLHKLMHVSDNYLAWMNNKNVLRFLANPKGQYDKESLKQFISDMNGSSNNYLFGIFWKEDDQHIGNIKLGNIHPDSQQGDVGLIIGVESFWGKGIATEAITLVSQFAFDHLKVKKLTAGMVGSNIASYKAFLKVGFRETGQLKQHSILEGQYVDYILVEKCAG